MKATTALAQQISQEELREKILHTWQAADESWVIPIEVAGIDLSINKIIWFLFIGAAITFIILFIGSRVFKDRPGAYRVIVEELYGFGRNYLSGQIGEEGRKWLPYTLTLFVFLLTLNIIGLIPNSYPVTSNIAFTLTLAVLTFILTQYQGIRSNGVGRYLKSFAPPELPFKAIMVPFMVFSEVIQQITRPLTLALRLYANILAGHLIIFVFLSFILYFGLFTSIVFVPIGLVFYAFEIFIAVIQAYIFAILTQIYIELAMFSEET